MPNYIPPSKCESCAPTERYADYITEYAHETNCPNRKTP